MASHLESELLFQIKAKKLPAPETEFKAVPGRRFRYDLAWVSQKLLVEIQGGVWVKSGHSTGTGINRDCEKLSLATLEGYRVLQVTGGHIKSGLALEWITKALWDSPLTPST